MRGVDIRKGGGTCLEKAFTVKQKQPNEIGNFSASGTAKSYFFRPPRSLSCSCTTLAGVTL